MRSTQELIGIGIGGVVSGAVVLLATQPAIAAAKVTAVQLNPTAAGVSIVLQTKGGDRPQVFSVNRGNTWTADLVNTQLAGGSFRKANPAPGIALVTVAAIDKNSVRVSVTGQNAAPAGQVSRPDGGGLVFNLTRRSSGAAATTPQSTAAANARLTRSAASSNQFPSPQSAAPRSAASPSAAPSSAAPLPALPNTLAQSAPPAASPANPGTANPNGSIAPANANPLPPFQGGAPLVPNPTVTVEGRPYVAPAPIPPDAPIPLPRAVAPPVGDIAVSQTDASSSFIDLGTAERVPRLVLRDASSREVLSLLARSAGLNIVFTNNQTGQPGQPGQPPGQPGQATGDGPKVTLDVVNEPVQNVFNYVLQITGLDASRRGNTIFVGTRLPNSARNVVIRSLRLNQVPVSTALPFLVSLGAESAVSRERLVTAVNAVPITNIAQAGTAASALTQTQTTTEQRIEVQRVAYTDSTPVLRGLQISGDERTNTVTLVGDSRRVEIAIAQLTQLDVRRRQVAVNVRVVDVDLLAFDRLGTSFSFGIGDSQFASTAGIAVLNFGQTLPATGGLTSSLGLNTVTGAPTSLRGGLSSTNAAFTNRFLLQLQAAITNDSAKILTDPTLVVQEGQRAQVELGDEVITNIRQTVTSTGTGANTIPQVTVEIEKANAGLTLPISIDRIDDNGFISLSVAPLISRPSSTQNISFSSGGATATNPITLLTLRRVQSGQVRLRDGQTLLLSGIIQDSDRVTVTKVPILGDIPILGALFRSSSTQNQRREVIVLLTPRILDDSDRSAFGYSYTPGVETRKILQQNAPRR